MLGRRATYGTSKRDVSSATRARSFCDAGAGLDVVERFGDDLADLARLAAPKPRDVTAGVPMRMPLVTIGFCVSNGIAFLFTVIWISSR